MQNVSNISIPVTNIIQLFGGVFSRLDDGLRAKLQMVFPLLRESEATRFQQQLISKITEQSIKLQSRTWPVTQEKVGITAY